MSINFQQISPTVRRPFVYVEFNNTRASQGPSIKVFKNLLLGQQTSSATVTAGVPTLISSAQDVAAKFGFGSMLHKMAQAYFLNNTSIETWAIGIADNGAGVQATGTLAFTGPASAAGTIVFYIGGDRYTAGVNSGDSATTIGAAVAAAVTADQNASVTAGASTGTVTFTQRHKGLLGNECDLRLNYYQGEVLPTGVACTVTAFASGATNPTVSVAIAAMADVQYDCILMPYTDTSNLTLMETELLTRWGPNFMDNGLCFSAKNDTYANLVTYGDAQNSQFVSTLMATKVPSLSVQVAAGYMGAASASLQIDPALPLGNLQVLGLLAPAPADRLTNAQREILLHNGISTFKTNASGQFILERCITTYQTNSAGAVDPSYLQVETIFTLSYLRYDFRNQFNLKYPRFKLASDGNKFGAGQNIMTPMLAKAECVSIFLSWMNIGLVQNVAQFKNDLICERNVSDPNRLDILLPPNLIDQLFVTATQIQFLL